MRTKFYNLHGRVYPDEEKYRAIYFPKKDTKCCLLLNNKNNIWLDRRKKLSFDKRIKPYKFIGLEKWLKSDSDKKVKYLDLHFLDPLTGVMNNDFIHMCAPEKWKKAVMLYVNEECVEKVNSSLSWEMGDVVLHVAAKVLSEIKEIIVRFYYSGLYFVVLDAKIDSIVEAKMKLARTSIFFSNGYHIKGIGLKLKDLKNFPSSYPLSKIWGGITKTEILPTASVTEKVEWVSVFICSRLEERIEGEFLKFIWNG